ncbi:MAG: hypothetical protein VW935_08495, partial [Novosphingobium sp.]
SQSCVIRHLRAGSYQQDLGNATGGEKHNVQSAAFCEVCDCDCSGRLPGPGRMRRRGHFQHARANPRSRACSDTHPDTDARAGTCSNTNAHGDPFRNKL